MADEAPDAAGDAGAPRPAPERRWQSADSASGDAVERGAERRSWLIGLAAALLALVTLAVVWVMYIKPRPPDVHFLTIHINDYDARSFPVCEFADEDGRLLLSRFRKGEPSITKSKQLLRNKLEELKTKQEEHLVVHVASLALVREGTVYILPSDADIDNPTSWVEVGEVVRAMQASPAKQKLLILDLARPMVDPRLGVLTDRVADALEDYFEKEKPPFHVFLACSKGQHSLTSETLQSSVFAYYLELGLCRHADTDGDLSISVSELFTYIEKKVDHWAQVNRGLRQQPLWFGREAADFSVVNVPSQDETEALKAQMKKLEKSKADKAKAGDAEKSKDDKDDKSKDEKPKSESADKEKEAKAKKEAEQKIADEKAKADAEEKAKAKSMDAAKRAAYPAALKKGWEERDRVVTHGAAHRAPRQLHWLDAHLLRLENRWRGGALQVKDSELTLDRDTRTLIEEFKASLAVSKAPPRSLPLADAKEDLDLAGDVGRMLLANVKAGVDKKDYAKIADELAKKLTPAADDKNADPSRGPWALVQAVSQLEQVASSHLVVARDAFAKMNEAQKEKLGFVEIEYIRRLAHFSTERTPEPKHVQAILQTMRAQVGVIAALDRMPECLPWIAARVKDADEKRREGERRLLWEVRSTWDSALGDLQAAKENYDLAKKAIETLRMGRTQLDRAYAELPAFMNLLCDWPEEDSQNEREWDRAAEEAATLAGILSQPPKDQRGDILQAFKAESPGRNLKGHLDKLERMLALRLARAEKDETAYGQRQLLCLLNNPLLKAAKRTELIDKQRRWALKLHERTDSADPPEGRSMAERQAGIARGRMSLALLRLAGREADSKTVDLSLKSRLDSKDQTALERTLRTLWGKSYSERWRAATAASAPDFAADGLNRLLPPFGQESQTALLNLDLNQLLQRNQREAYLRWLRESYRAEARYLKSEPGEQDLHDFYVRAAQEVQP